jgi:hypothetical protein
MDLGYSTMPLVTRYGTNAHATPAATNIFLCEVPHIQKDIAGALSKGQSGDASCWSAGLSNVEVLVSTRKANMGLSKSHWLNI